MGMLIRSLHEGSLLEKNKDTGHKAISLYARCLCVCFDVLMLRFHLVRCGFRFCCNQQ